MSNITLVKKGFYVSEPPLIIHFVLRVSVRVSQSIKGTNCLIFFIYFFSLFEYPKYSSDVITTKLWGLGFPGLSLNGIQNCIYIALCKMLNNGELIGQCYAFNAV